MGHNSKKALKLSPGASKQPLLDDCCRAGSVNAARTADAAFRRDGGAEPPEDACVLISPPRYCRRKHE